MSKILVGFTCHENSKYGCVHTINIDGRLNIWNIKYLRQRINDFDTVHFVGADYLDFEKGDDIFEKAKRYPELSHFISGGIKASCSVDSL